MDSQNAQKKNKRVLVFEKRISQRRFYELAAVPRRFIKWNAERAHKIRIRIGKKKRRAFAFIFGSCDEGQAVRRNIPFFRSRFGACARLLGACGRQRHIRARGRNLRFSNPAVGSAGAGARNPHCNECYGIRFLPQSYE